MCIWVKLNMILLFLYVYSRCPSSTFGQSDANPQLVSCVLSSNNGVSATKIPHKAVTPGFVSSPFEAPTGQLPWPLENWLLDSGKLMFCPRSVSWLSLTCSTLIIFQRNSLHREMRQGFYTASGSLQRTLLRGEVAVKCSTCSVLSSEDRC